MMMTYLQYIHQICYLSYTKISLLIIASGLSPFHIKIHWPLFANHKAAVLGLIVAVIIIESPVVSTERMLSTSEHCMVESYNVRHSKSKQFDFILQVLNLWQHWHQSLHSSSTQTSQISISFHTWMQSDELYIISTIWYKSSSFNEYIQCAAKDSHC